MRMLLLLMMPPGRERSVYQKKTAFRMVLTLYISYQRDSWNDLSYVVNRSSWGEEDGSMRIRSVTNANEPLEGEYPANPPQMKFPSLRQPGAIYNGLARIFFTPEAVEQLFEFIHWDEKTAQNRVEQAGIMYGITYKLPGSAASDTTETSGIRGEQRSATRPTFLCATPKPQQGETMPLETAVQQQQPSFPFTWSVVHGIIPSQTMDCSPVHINISADEWQRMATELDRLNAEQVRRGEMEMQQVGWFHTHPNQLEPFYSDLDVMLQRIQASNMDRYGAVFNPHRRIFAVYAGPNSQPDQGVLLLDQEQVQRFNMQGLEMGDPSLTAGEPVVKLKKRSPFMRMVNDVMNRFTWEESDFSEERQGWSFDPIVARMMNFDGERWRQYSLRDSVLMSSVERLRAIRDAFAVNADLSILAVWRRARTDGFYLDPIMAWCHTSALPRDIVDDESLSNGYCIVRFIHDADKEREAREYRQHPERMGGMTLVMITERLDVYTV